MTSILSWILLQSWWYVIIYIHASPNSWGILLIPWYSIIKRGTTMDFFSIITELMAQSCVWLFLINIYKKCKDYSKWEGGHTRKRPFIRLDITWMAHRLGHTCTININYFNNVSSFTSNWSVAWPDFSARQVLSVAHMMNARSFIYEPAIWIIIPIARVELAWL